MIAAPLAIESRCVDRNPSDIRESIVLAERIVSGLSVSESSLHDPFPRHLRHGQPTREGVPGPTDAIAPDRGLIERSHLSTIAA